jgi:hypothetical protein
MGGVFSGRRWSKKPVVEGCLAIDTADLKRWKLLAAGPKTSTGTLRWGKDGAGGSSVDYRLVIEEGAGTFRLSYQLGKPPEPVRYSVRMVTTDCHLGGVRWWFLCPLLTNDVACGRRVRKLYLRGKYFGCRHCHGLTYRSCQESDSRVYAARRGGLDLSRFDHPDQMSLTQLARALKALTLEQKRLDRLLSKADARRPRD